jgi:hypothetical protein
MYLILRRGDLLERIIQRGMAAVRTLIRAIIV